MSQTHPHADYRPHEQNDAMRVGASVLAAGLAASTAAWLAGASTLALTSLATPATSPARAPRILVGLVQHGSEPWLAWPAPERARMSHDAIVWWLTALPGLVLFALLATTAVIVVRELVRDGSQSDPRGARPALRLLSLRPRAGRFPLGRRFGLQVSSGAESHLLVIGPTGSGKTSACLIPALLTHLGSAIVVSTKQDIRTRTIVKRRSIGRVIEWAPFDDEGEPWDLLAGCESWQGACRRSESLVHAARLDAESSTAQFWDTHTDRALAPYLLAARTANLPPSTIYGWVASQRSDEPQRLLAQAEIPTAERDAALLDLRTATILSPDDRSSLAISIIRVLSPLRLPSLARAVAGGFTPEAVCDRAQPATLYITIPDDEQRQLRAFVVALVEASYRAAYNAGRHEPFDPPLLLLIDEAAHTAPLRDLPEMLQVARECGIRIATSWQDASQIEHRYGRTQAQSIISASQTRVILPGCTDTRTLELARASMGEREQRVRRSDERPPLDPRRLDGRMLVSHAHDAAFLLRPAPWYRSRAMRRLANPAEAAAGGATRPPGARTRGLLRRGPS